MRACVNDLETERLYPLLARTRGSGFISGFGYKYNLPSSSSHFCEELVLKNSQKFPANFCPEIKLLQTGTPFLSSLKGIFSLFPARLLFEIRSIICKNSVKIYLPVMFWSFGFVFVVLRCSCYIPVCFLCLIFFAMSSVLFGVCLFHTTNVDWKLYSIDL